MARVGLGLLLLLAACGGPAVVMERPAPVWLPVADTTEIAEDECRELTDVTMRQHGFPTYPAAWTPHYAYRRTIFADCMAKKGYAPSSFQP